MRILIITACILNCSVSNVEISMGVDRESCRAVEPGAESRAAVAAISDELARDTCEATIRIHPVHPAVGEAGNVETSGAVRDNASRYLDHLRGRAFARFETRFQLVWVVGAAIPVVLPISLEFGMGALGFVAAFAAFSYYGSTRTRHQ